MKYTTVKVANIIIQVAKTTDVKGYTEGILERFLPDESSMSDKDVEIWIEENNKMMNDICDLLNKKY